MGEPEPLVDGGESRAHRRRSACCASRPLRRLRPPPFPSLSTARAVRPAYVCPRVRVAALASTADVRWKFADLAVARG